MEWWLIEDIERFFTLQNQNIVKFLHLPQIIKVSAQMLASSEWIEM